ncbi:MAG: DsbC family protein [Pseudomonadota bacterium]|nr:DsbC family protein [Pseudomonadota bacterium]
MNFRPMFLQLLVAALCVSACVARGGDGSATPNAAATAAGATAHDGSRPVTAADKPRLAAIGKLVEERLSGSSDGGTSVHVTSVRPMAMLGLYEVVTSDNKLVYTDDKVDYIISGHIYDLANMSDLTGERLEQINAIALDALPLDLAIKTVKGNGKRRMAVFSDTDCPFCRKLENEMANITDVTVYTFLFPIQSLHPSAPDHTRRIWCASDRLQAWNDYWKSNTLPEARDCDTSALDRILKLGADHHINGTPTLIFADGHVIPGAMPAAQLEKSLGPR